jgi:hypothetical protein
MKRSQMMRRIRLACSKRNEELLLEGVADEDEELEGVELEEDDPDDDAVPLGAPVPDEELLLEGVAEDDELPLGVLELLEVPELLGELDELDDPERVELEEEEPEDDAVPLGELEEDEELLLEGRG